MNNLGIYLHFPFCKSKCRYCDFYSLPEEALKDRYEEKLAEQIPYYAEGVGPVRVDTVYFGGGTPSLCSPKGLRRIMKSLKDSFSWDPQGEFTVECNPESAHEDFLSTARDVGFQRLSMGLQSALEEELSLLGRPHRFSDCRRAVERAKKEGFCNVSLDLMYGIPRQTLASFRESLKAAVDLGVSHLSFYCLTLSPHVPLARSGIALPSEEETREMYLMAVDFLEENGFFQYEISNAAQKGMESRHNLRYWKGEAYLGIGPGAHSFFRNRRFCVEEGVKEFLDSSHPRDRIRVLETLSEADLATEYLMLSLRTAEGLDLDRVAELFSPQKREETEKKFSLWASHGLARKTERGFALTPAGFFVSNEIISELI